MIRLIKLYADDDMFRPVEFKPGMNIIRGDDSTDDSGEITSRRQNGVGKSFSIELIDFCFMRVGSESKVMKIKDKYFPKNIFVYLHFEANGRQFVVARNRNNEIKIKSDKGLFKKYSFEDAKKYLALITGLDETPLSWRDYFNFFIKHEEYSYTNFNQLYHSSYSDLMKIHFYLFGLSLDTLKDIVKAFNDFDQATVLRREVNKWLKDQELDIEQIRAKKNEIDQKVERLEDSFDYSNLISSYADKQSEISLLEQHVNELIEQRSILQIELKELNDFIDDFRDDIYIDDADITTVFNKYSKGLGNIIAKDLGQLFKFRDQLSSFKADLTLTKKQQLLTGISELSEQITSSSSKVNKFYQGISQADKNTIVKSFRVYKDDIQDTQQYDQYLDQFDRAESAIGTAKTEYAVAINRLHLMIAALKEVKESFEKDFLDIHQRVTGSDSASFDFSVNVDSNVSRKSEFFRFSVIVETGGSKGSNQIRAAIYDAAIHRNPLAKEKTQGLLVHDNLVFGTMDKESSINFLNVMSEFDPNELQYIATVNNDEFDYQELKERFKFDIEKDVVINLTRKEPLFHDIQSDFIKE